MFLLLPVSYLFKKENKIMTPSDIIKSRIDGRKNPNVKTGKVLEMEWMWSDYVEIFLRKIVDQFGHGKTLNMCCGASNLGDVRVDIDPRSNRTRSGDLFRLRQQFHENQFNVGIFDPDFDAYNPNSRLTRLEGKKLGYERPGQLAYDWQYDAVSLCRKVAIFRRNLIMINHKDADEEFFLIRDSRPSATILHLVWRTA